MRVTQCVTGINMRRGRLLLLSAVVIFTMLASSMPANAITYGTADTTHTYVGAWVFQLPDGRFRWCSGELVSARVFLTAGHCVVGFAAMGATPQTTWVTFDTNIFPAPFLPPSDTPGFVPGFKPPAPDWKAVSSFVADPLFKFYVCAGGCPMDDPHDHGVVILKKPVTSVGLANLPPVGLLDSLPRSTVTKATISLLGYGRDQNLTPTAQRRIAHASILGISPAWLHTGATNASGNGGVCGSDSGGAELLNVGGTEYLVATAALITSCDLGVDFGNRVDTASAQPFILSEIAANA